MGALTCLHMWELKKLQGRFHVSILVIFQRVALTLLAIILKIAKVVIVNFWHMYPNKRPLILLSTEVRFSHNYLRSFAFNPLNTFSEM
uniref:Uncharacterized protein n=1 Tax=Rhizophora mucronata TaxID=61149 RepID=A0A2P2P2G9_RHIMU